MEKTGDLFFFWLEVEENSDPCQCFFSFRVYIYTRILCVVSTNIHIVSRSIR